MRVSDCIFTTAWIFIIFFMAGFLSAENFEISAQMTGQNTVRIDFKVRVDTEDMELFLYRSVAKLTDSNIDKIRYPITEFRITPEGGSTTFFDHHVAHNVTYHYLALIRKKGQNLTIAASNTVEISVPDVAIGEPANLVILIDKRHYYLEIQNKGKAVKRYPVSLGRDPIKRKIHQDNKTTPEGLYKIINIQQNATFYKAIDIDYPNALDRIRYDFLKTEGLIPEGRGIGGEIQVHGKHPRFGSIQRNWTWGCISLRNADVDEIFEIPALKVGIPVIIIGQDFSRDDAVSMNAERPVEDIKSAQEKLAELGFYKGKMDGILGRQTQFAIGRFQKDRGLPISCLLDGRTADLLLTPQIR